MIKITEATVEEVEDTLELKWFVLDKRLDNYESFNEICNFYGVTGYDLRHSDLQFQWDKISDVFSYSIVINELDSWGFDLDELSIYVRKDSLTPSELRYILVS